MDWGGRIEAAATGFRKAAVLLKEAGFKVRECHAVPPNSEVLVGTAE